MPTGQKHILTCRCILSQFKAMEDPPFHQFVVFSVEDDDGVVQPKVVQCNNCGVLHKVTEYCKSEILDGKESARALVGVEEVKMGLGQNIVSVLEARSADMASWEQASFIVENERWGDCVFLEKELDEDATHGTYVEILGENLCRVKSFVRNEVAK